MAQERDEGWRGLVAAGLLVVALLLHGWWASRNWESPGLNGHEFRQTQTAVSIQAMLKGPWSGPPIDYATPVLGKPWAIPMEYPLYQWLVASACRVTGWPIAQAGRGVSMVAFWVALAACWRLVRWAGLSRSGACLALVPILCTPVYIFYSRTVMIESLALAASAWFLVGVLGYRARPGLRWLLLALGAGVVAVLVKATTWAVFCVPWALLWLGDGWRAVKARRWPVGWLEQAVLIGGTLLLIGFGWVWLADQIKALNPNAGFLISNQLTEFNFGTRGEHLDPEIWRQLGRKAQEAVGFGWVLLGGLLLGVAMLGRKLPFWLALSGFVAGPMIFLGLYYRHEYYFYANAAFAAMGLGAIPAVLWDRSNRREWGWLAAALVSLVVVAGGQFAAYHRTFYTEQMSSSDPDSWLYRVIREATKPEEVIVVQSPSWSSEIPYYTNRSVMTVPDFQMFFHAEAVRDGVANLHDESVGLLIFKEESRTRIDWMDERIRELGMMRAPVLNTDGVTIFASKAALDRTIRALKANPPQDETWRSCYERAPVAEQRVLTEQEARALDVFKPLPSRAVLPEGVDSVDDVGPTAVLPSSSELYLPVAGTGRVLAAQFRVTPDAYSHPEFDGVDLLFEAVLQSGEIVVLAEPWVDARYQILEMPLPDDTVEVAIRVLPGRNFNDAFDRVWFKWLRLY